MNKATFIFLAIMSFVTITLGGIILIYATFGNDMKFMYLAFCCLAFGAFLFIILAVMWIITYIKSKKE